MTGCSNGLYTYFSYFAGITGSITVIGSKQLVWATETLESYGVTATSDYPAGATVMHGINLSTDSGLTPPTVWSVVNDAADGLSTIVNRQGPTNAQVTFYY